jgi:hypothetical protein
VAGRRSDLANVFAPHQVRHEAEHSVIRAAALDQAGLYGVVARVQALGLDLLEIKIVA